jgi:hypothetical protein
MIVGASNVVDRALEDTFKQIGAFGRINNKPYLWDEWLPTYVAG